MSKIIFISGGARSGKSRHALHLAKAYRRVLFIATAQGLDGEMRRRIELHKKNRPRHWSTIEEHRDVAGILGKIAGQFDCLIIDCLTLLVSNLIIADYSKMRIKNEINKIIRALRKIKGTVIIVSNEVGLGIVPDNELGREFRDIAGSINQIFAKAADWVFFIVSGIPWRIK